MLTSLGTPRLFTSSICLPEMTLPARSPRSRPSLPPSPLPPLFAGSPPNPAQLRALLSARPATPAAAGKASDKGINFTTFATMMSEQLSFLDGESEIKEAFASFDADDSGLVEAATLRRYLKEEGDAMTDEEVRRLLC